MRQREGGGGGAADGAADDGELVERKKANLTS